MNATGHLLHRARRRAAIVSVSTVALVAPTSALAATITVTTTVDVTTPADNLCSLREATTAARTGSPSGPVAGECPAGDAGLNTIVLPSGHYVLGAGGALSITSSLTISGGGAATTTIDGNGVGRVLQVGAAPAVVVTGVTITGGHAPDGVATGLPAQRVGGSGGGISNIGVLTLADTVVSGNRAGGGLPGSPDPAIGKRGRVGGAGGGIWNAGTLTLIRTTVSGNGAGNGGRGFYTTSTAAGPGGDGGAGGGIASASGASLTILESTISGNRAGDGGAGGEGSPPTSVAGGGGTGGAGGGVWNAGTLSIGTSTIAGNGAGRGGTGGANGGGTGQTGGPGGAGGYGGGLYDASVASETIANTTVSANGAGAGGDGVQGGYGGSGGGGGGVVSAGGTLTIVSATISGNQVGGGGADGGGGAGGIGGGGGINAFGAASLQNTIVAGNSGGNCLGATVDAGHDISYPDASCVGTNRDPQLGPLQGNGGPTATVGLGPGSAAIDQVPADAAGCPTSDQRGLPRPQGAGCDIGAFELGVIPTLLTPPTALVAAGQPLACATGSWRNEPLTYTYAWLRDGTPIDGATGAAYSPTSADAGHGVACRVTATNPTGSASAASAAVPIPPIPARPVVASRPGVSPRSFRAAASGASAIGYRATAAQRRSGTRVSFTLSAAANVRFVARQSRPGRVRGKGAGARCVAPTKRNAKARHCTRVVTLTGSFTRAGVAGSNRFHFSGRLRGRRLVPGRYVLVATPTAAGVTGRAVTIRFTILRP